MNHDSLVNSMVEMMQDHGILEHRHEIRRLANHESEILFDDYFALLVRSRPNSDSEEGQLVLSCYAASIRKYGLDLMERVGAISLPRDFETLSQPEAARIYMGWLAMQKQWALERVRGNMDAG